MSENKITTTIIGEDGSGTCIRYAYINKDNLFSGMYDGAYIKLGNESRGSSGAIKVEDMYQAFKERMMQELVAIDTEQESLGNLERHNEKVRGDHGH